MASKKLDSSLVAGLLREYVLKLGLVYDSRYKICRGSGKTTELVVYF